MEGLDGKQRQTCQRKDEKALNLCALCGQETSHPPDGKEVTSMTEVCNDFSLTIYHINNTQKFCSSCFKNKFLSQGPHR